ncbi:hypothetical protein C3E79_07835 [Corynebacterium liangguodongii]|uniref:Uncharacterized protein n=1 Tax=Corynebacterium liangguodongii TaxID=2079535 RepID=A0A2S0WF45_9CORY|nr:hypothetical protein C3E79_07835 [Corynebacterium liangguodongii]
MGTATFADLAALVDAARAAGIDAQAPISLRDGALGVEVEAAQGVDKQAKPAPHARPLGDAALRSVIELLSERAEPPR